MNRNEFCSWNQKRKFQPDYRCVYVVWRDSYDGYCYQECEDLPGAMRLAGYLADNVQATIIYYHCETIWRMIEVNEVKEIELPKLPELNILGEYSLNNMDEGPKVVFMLSRILHEMATRNYCIEVYSLEYIEYACGVVLVGGNYLYVYTDGSYRYSDKIEKDISNALILKVDGNKLTVAWGLKK